MYIPAILVFLAILYMVFQSILIAFGLVATVLATLYGLFLIVYGDTAKSKRYTLNTICVLMGVIPCAFALADFYFP